MNPTRNREWPGFQKKSSEGSNRGDDQITVSTPPKVSKKATENHQFWRGPCKTSHLPCFFLVVETPNGQKIQREHKIGWAYL